MSVERRRTRGRTIKKGRWEVERERCRIEDVVPPAAETDASGLADVIPNLMKKLGLADQHWLGAVEQEWPTLAGEAVAKHARPGKMEGRKLTVFVDSSVWLSELVRYGQKQLLQNLQKRFGSDKIGSIFFALDPEGNRRR